MPDYCLHCCLEHSRCTCDDATKNQPVQNQPPSLPAGVLLKDRYRIGRVIGASGFGNIYLAVDEELGHRVAIKEYMLRGYDVISTDVNTVMPDDSEGEDTFRYHMRRFLVGTMALAKISEMGNPRIVSVLDYFRANNTVYQVMSYLEGQTLSSLLKSRGLSLPEEEAKYYVTAILDGLRDLHNEGVVHCDIKPHNVFLTNDGGVKIIDFGAVRTFQQEARRDITVVVSPPYAPFEQYSLLDKLGPWTDIYAVGITFYQMLTGRLPKDALQRLRDPSVELPHEATGGKVSKDLDAVVAKAISPETEDRFQSVDEFQEALARPSLVKLVPEWVFAPRPKENSSFEPDITRVTYCPHCCLERSRCTCDDATKEQTLQRCIDCLPVGVLLDGKYRVGRVLGSGRFGITYLALDERLGHRVAIKEYMPRHEAVRDADGCTVMPRTFEDKEEYEFGVEQFLTGAQVLARISQQDNPGIVGIQYFFKANNTAYLVMRYLEGQTLGGLLHSRGGSLPEEEAKYYVTAILDGLREFHNEGVVHSCVTPHNVFITSDGGVKLIDFGPARFSAFGVNNLGSMVVVSPPYAPFEQYSLLDKLGPWTDIYAVGITFYQMLTGRLPGDALQRLRDPSLELPHEATGGKVSKDLDVVVAKAISPETEDRFQSVDEFQEALARTH